MPFDSARAASLIARAAFNAEFFRGTIQDLSSAKRAMSFVGAPTWSRINGRPCLKQNAAGDGTTSGVVDNIVDVTAPFWVEALFTTTNPGAACYVLQQGAVAAGGFIFYWSLGAGTLFRVELYDGAAGGARSVNTPAASGPYNTTRHVIIGIEPLVGSCWINGVPGTPLVVNTRAATNCAPRAVRMMGTVGGGCQAGFIRCTQGTPSQEDATCLYQQARILTGGDV